MKRIFGAVLALTLVVAVQANAAPTIDPTPGETIPGVQNCQTSGDDMAGMLVRVDFVVGGPVNAVWAATGLGAGAAGGPFGSGNWSLSLSGDSFSNPWLLVNTTGVSIKSIWIDAFPGNTVFDIKSDSTYTPNSALGKANFTEPPQYATFKSAVAIAGDPNSPYGDLYRYLKIDFDPLLSCDGRTQWYADTDTIAPVPLPGGILLLSSGLLSLLRLRRRV